MAGRPARFNVRSSNRDPSLGHRHLTAAPLTEYFTVTRRTRAHTDHVVTYIPSGTKQSTAARAKPHLSYRGENTLQHAHTERTTAIHKKPIRKLIRNREKTINPRTAKRLCDSFRTRSAVRDELLHRLSGILSAYFGREKLTASGQVTEV